MPRGSERDRERFSRARRDLIDALQLWRMLSETPEEERDETLQEIVAIAERSLAEASGEYQAAAASLGHTRPPPSSSGLRAAADRRSDGRPRISTMRTEDLMMFEPPPEPPGDGWEPPEHE